MLGWSWQVSSGNSINFAESHLCHCVEPPLLCVPPRLVRTTTEWAAHPPSTGRAVRLRLVDIHQLTRVTGTVRPWVVHRVQHQTVQRWVRGKVRQGSRGGQWRAGRRRVVHGRQVGWGACNLFADVSPSHLSEVAPQPLTRLRCESDAKNERGTRARRIMVVGEM